MRNVSLDTRYGRKHQLDYVFVCGSSLQIVHLPARYHDLAIALIGKVEKGCKIVKIEGCLMFSGKGAGSNGANSYIIYP